MVAAANPFDQFDSSSPAASAAPAAAAPAAPQSSNPFDQFGPAPGAASPAPAAAPVTYNAALFQQRVGRAPENSQELANFAAQKGAGFAGDPGATTAPGENAVNDFASGAATSVADTGRGVYQLGASMAHAAGLISDQKLAEIQSSVDAAKQDEAPLLATTAGKVGNIAGQAAQFAAVGPESLIGSAATGGALAAAQPVATGGSRLQNTAEGAIGGAAGAAGGRVVGALLGGAGGADAARAAAASVMDDSGIPLSVAQRTGSKLAQQTERASDMVSSAGDAFTEAQQSAVNRAVLKSVGVDDPSATAATPEVLAKAKANITGVMDTAAARGTNLDDALTSDLKEFQDNLPGQIPNSQAGPIRRNIADLNAAAQANGGTIPGTILQRVRTNLGTLTRNPQIGDAASDLQDILDDAVGRSTPPADQAALAAARSQYRNLKQVEQAVNPDGDVSLKKLGSVLFNSRAYRNQALYGQGDQSLINLVRAGRLVDLTDPLGNSGTAERLVGPVGAIEALGSGEPVKAGAKLVAGAVGLGAAGRALRSQGLLGDYLSGGVPGLSGAAAGAPAVGGAFGAGTILSQLDSQPSQPNQ